MPLHQCHAARVRGYNGNVKTGTPYSLSITPASIMLL
jgi:hypothetical protein